MNYRSLKSTPLLVTLVLMSVPLPANPPPLPHFPPLRFQPPKPERVELPNGMVLFLLEDHEIPLIKLFGQFRIGTQYDPPHQLGLGLLLGSGLSRGGTLHHSPEQVEQILDRLAGSLSFSVGLEAGEGSMSCRKEDFDVVFGLFVESLREPLFRKDRLELTKDTMREGLRRLNDDPEEMARREFRKIIFGPDHPYARTATPETLKALTRESVIQWHKRFFHPNQIMLAVAGDFDATEMKTKITKAFGSWPKQRVDLPETAKALGAPGGVYFIKRSINQSQIRIGDLGMTRLDPDHYAWRVFNELWGGSATSWLFSKVRTQQGLAYSVGSGYSEMGQAGIIVAMSQTRASQTITAIQSIQKINKEVSEAPFSDADIRGAKVAIQNRFIDNFTSSAQIAQQVMTMEYYGYPKNYLETYTAHIGAITSADLKRVGKRFLQGNQSSILVVGDLSLFEKPLSTLGKPKEIRPPDYSEDHP